MDSDIISCRKESNQMLKPKTPKEQIVELFTGKTIEEIEENNRIVEALLNEAK